MKALIIATDGIVNQLIVFIIALALIYFFWGLVKFIFKSGDATAREEGREIMKWGIITLFVMVSILGLIKFVGTALGIPTNVTLHSTGGSSDPSGCTDEFGNPTYTGDCGTY